MNILGAEYTVIHDLDELKREGSDGICSAYQRTINIRLPKEMLDDEEIEIKNKRFNEVLRHELIHAFMHESGLAKYEGNEDLVEWLARMFPKMAATFKDEGVEQ